MVYIKQNKRKTNKQKKKLFIISAGGVTFYNNPGTVNISEDQDAETPLWTITADCTYVEAYYGPCPRRPGADCSPELTSTTVACTECDISSNPDPNLFEIQGE